MAHKMTCDYCLPTYNNGLRDNPYLSVIEEMDMAANDIGGGGWEEVGRDALAHNSGVDHKGNMCFM